MYTSQKITKNQWMGLLATGLLVAGFAQAQENGQPAPEGPRLEVQQDKAQVKADRKVVKQDREKLRHDKHKTGKKSPEVQADKAQLKTDRAKLHADKEKLEKDRKEQNTPAQPSGERK